MHDNILFLASCRAYMTLLLDMSHILYIYIYLFISKWVMFFIYGEPNLDFYHLSVTIAINYHKR